jgi:hypothetical protein
MSLLNKFLSFFGLGRDYIHQEEILSPINKISEIVESPPSDLNADIQDSTVDKSITIKKSKSTSSIRKKTSDINKVKGVRKPRVPKKPKEE